MFEILYCYCIIHPLWRKEEKVNTFNLNLNVHVVRNSAGDFCQEKLELGQFQHVLLGAGRHFLHVNKLTQQNEECVQSQSRKTLKSVCLNCNFYI